MVQVATESQGSMVKLRTINYKSPTNTLAKMRKAEFLLLIASKNYFERIGFY